jgi:type III secretory pathway component EscU
LFANLKESYKARGYNVELITRSIIFVAVLVFGQELTMAARLMYMIIVQLLYFPLISLTAPFKNPVENIIETINEIYFLMLITILLFFNVKSHWKGKLLFHYLFQ